MKKFMKLIEVFDENIFHDIENAKEEKFRFYPEDIHASGEYNKKFVRELIEKPHLKMAIPKKILSYFEKRELINDCKKIFVKDKIEFIDDNRLIVSFLKYLGTYLFDKGYLTESEKYFKILLKKQKFLNEEDIKKIMYHLFGIEKIQQKSVFYGKKLLELILDKKRKTFEEKLIISDVFATLDDNKSSYKWLKKALNSKKNLSIYEINKYYTLLFIICIKLKKKYCKSHINKAIKLMIASVENKDHRYFTVIGSLYKKIKKYDKAIEVFKLALRKIEPHKKIFANDILLIYFNLGELFEKQGKKLYLEFYKKAIDLLKFKKGKTDIDIYRIASLFKKTGELNKSTKWFNRLLKKPIKPSLKAGVFFHLAEIYYLQNKTDKSLDYFKKCLSMNPNHIKAKNYVMKIESAK
jgi:tetratricopeptide (TPR) repeat protein